MDTSWELLIVGQKPMKMDSSGEAEGACAALVVVVGLLLRGDH